MKKTKSTHIIPVYQVDAFTSQPFKGNPAAVCLLKKPMDEATMQNIAKEMNLSETAFLYPLENAQLIEASLFSLRWFTPLTEVPLCGHATLSASAVLFDGIGHSGPILRFETKSGQLTAKKEQEGILLNFPSEMPQATPLPRSILEALGGPKVIHAAYAQKSQMLLLHLESEEELRQLSPDFERLQQAETLNDMQEGLIVTSSSQPPYDFVSRFFAPWIGINEDPVTGSAHTILAPYWAEKLGKNELLAYQASFRGGQIKLQLVSSQRVHLLGQAVIILKGELQW